MIWDILMLRKPIMPVTASSDPANAIRGHVLVFDSGVGGLTVAQDIAALLPNVHIDYAADTGFFPYGDKSDAQLSARVPQMALALYQRLLPDVFVIACNTASTLAIEAVRAVLPCPVIGTVPAIKPAAAMSKTGVIGLLATPGTLKRSYTARLIADFAADKCIIPHGSIALVKLAEAAAGGHTPPLQAFVDAQAPLFHHAQSNEMDVIVLACTHFPLVRDQLMKSAPRHVTYIDSGAAIAQQTKRVLKSLKTEHRAHPKHASVYTTSDPTNQPHLADVFPRYGFKTLINLSL